MLRLTALLAVAALLATAPLRLAEACTSFVVDCNDGAVVSVRTM